MSEAVADIDQVVEKVTEAEGALRRSWCWRWLLYLLVFSPVIVLAYAVGTNSVDVPVWDGWERGEMWRRYFEGTLDFQFLYSPHIEHRSLIPRLIQLAYGNLFGGDVRYEIWTTTLLVIGTCLLAFRVITHTLGKGISRWPTAFLVNAVICSPAQYPDLLWPVQMAFMFPIFCLMAIMATAVSRLPVWAKFTLILLAAEVGTHSFSQGLVLWPVAVCIILFSPQGFGKTLKKRLIPAALMLVFAVVTIVPYFTWHFETTSDISHTFHTATGDKPSSFSKLENLRENPKKVREYSMRSLGNPVVRIFSRDPSGDARNVGRCVLILFIAAMLFMVWRRKDRVSWEKLLPWAAAAWFAFSTAILLGLGRAGMAGDRAVMPRYIPMTMYLIVALIVFGAYACQWWSAQTDNRRERARRNGWGWAAAALTAILMLNLWQYGLQKMTAWRAARLEARAILVYLNLFDPPKVERLDNTIEFVRKQANYLSSKGLLNTPMMEHWDFGPFKQQTRKIGADNATLAPSGMDKGRLVVHGFALLPEGRPADGALITVRQRGAEKWQVIGMGEMRDIHYSPNQFLDDPFGDGHNLSAVSTYAAYTGSADAAGLTPGEYEVQCWAMDAHHFRAYPIDQIRTVKIAAKAPTPLPEPPPTQ